jgi:hypothetical protein
MSSPTNAVIEALRTAIDAKRKELVELEAAVVKYTKEVNGASGQQKIRFRRKTGFKDGSIPDLVNKILAETGQPMSASELVIALKAKGRQAESNMIAANIARYIGTNFQRNTEGKYKLMT